jgi:MerR family transcriptional regulator, copper efflux regulator
MPNGRYTIGEFSKLMGLSPRTTDFYTRQGLLHPEQNSRGHGYRRYSEEDRRRVGLIKQLQARKFSLVEIRKALHSSRGQNAHSAVESMEKIAVDLDRLRVLAGQTRSAASELEQPAIRVVATEALQKATALCSVLITLIQDLPLT